MLLNHKNNIGKTSTRTITTRSYVSKDPYSET